MTVTTQNALLKRTQDYLDLKASTKSSDNDCSAGDNNKENKIMDTDEFCPTQFDTHGGIDVIAINAQKK
jgi:hypothetical protein